MTHVPEVTKVEAHVSGGSGERLLSVTAEGRVSTTGWSSICLAPGVYVIPPVDGLWDFALIGDPPSGIVLQVECPVSANWSGFCPDWVKGVRVTGGRNSKEAKIVEKLVTNATITFSQPSAIKTGALVTVYLPAYDDSFQPTGNIKWNGLVPHIEMKKLRHEWVVTITGPNEDRIKKILADSTVIAAIAAVASGGLAAVSAFLASLQSHLGDEFKLEANDNSHWIYWYT